MKAKLNNLIGRYERCIVDEMSRAPRDQSRIDTLRTVVADLKKINGKE